MRLADREPVLDPLLNTPSITVPTSSLLLNHFYCLLSGAQACLALPRDGRHVCGYATTTAPEMPAQRQAEVLGTPTGLSG